MMWLGVLRGGWLVSVAYLNVRYWGVNFIEKYTKWNHGRYDPSLALYVTLKFRVSKLYSGQCRFGSESMRWRGERGGAWLASAGWSGWNVLRCELHWNFFRIKPWPLTARVAAAGWTQVLPCRWHWNFEVWSLIFIKDANVWIWIYDVAWCVRGRAGLQV
jgi:hypothetical protein